MLTISASEIFIFYISSIGIPGTGVSMKSQIIYAYGRHIAGDHVVKVLSMFPFRKTKNINRVVGRFQR